MYIYLILGLARKIKDDLCGVTKFKYIRNVGNRFLKFVKTNSEQRQFEAWSGVADTQIFCDHPPTRGFKNVTR